MHEIVCCIIFGFLIILGIVSIIEFLMLILFKVPKENVLEITESNLEYIFRSYLLHGIKINNIEKIAIVPQHHNETRKIYSVLCSDYSNTHIFLDI